MVAAICICAGLAMIVPGVRNEKWLLALLGPFGVWYGIAWVLVAHEGRLPGGRLRLNPWGRRKEDPPPTEPSSSATSHRTPRSNDGTATLPAMGYGIRST
jgi:hypothetical protein